MNQYPEVKFPHEFPWGIALFDGSTGTVVKANTSMVDLYGCEVGTQLDTIFSFSSDRKIIDIVGEMTEKGSWTGRFFPGENRYGLTSTEVTLQRDPEHPASIWLYTLEHPKVENRVRFSSRSELKMLRVILDNTLDYVFFRDLQGKFILTNQAFHKAVADDEQYPDIENTIREFASPESADWICGLDEKVIQTGEAAVNQIAEVTFKNGRKEWRQLTIVPVRSSEAEIIGLLSVAKDISSLKRTEADLLVAIDQANEASRARGQFLAAMSHEIRTPINGVIGASELCLETSLNAEQSGYVDTVIQCSNTLLTLVNDILDFSKIEAGQLNLEKLTFNPLKTVESVASELSAIASNKDLELIVACDATVPEFLMGDPTRLKQILYNLIGNAIKFTDHGEVVIRSKLLEESEDHARVQFTVEDTGIGIEASRREAIFDSFTQADMSTARRYGGTGLGLTICKELVSLMGGEIRVNSRVGDGTCFTFELPFERAKNVGAKSVPFNFELAGMRVLVVDDNEANRDIFQQMCLGWGYRAEAVSDGTSALSLLEEAEKEGEGFDLILLDQQMPGLTGLDLASLVRARPNLSKTKIILLSSSVARTESKRADAIGISRVLTKPLKRETLLEVIIETFNVGASSESGGPKNSSSQEIETSINLLLAEDNPINQTVAKRRLEKLGHKVTLADDGPSALKLARLHDFDGILMDIEMPGMDGYQTTAKIREYEQSEGITPHWIVAMTAHAMKGDRERCLAAGMNDYISKPFSSDSLKAVLATMIRESDRITQPKAGELDASHSDAIHYLENLEEGEREDVLLVAPGFVETLPEQIDSIKEALKKKDFERCRFLTHSLKGVVGLFGDKKGMAEFGALEKLLRTKGATYDSAMKMQFEKVESAVYQLSRELKAYSDARLTGTNYS